MTKTTLLADVGGTFTRLALSRDGSIEDVSIQESAAFVTFEDAIRDYLGDTGAAPQQAAIAAAGPASADVATMTNGPQWRIEGAALKATFGFASARVVNEFAAVAASAPGLAPDRLVTLSEGAGAARDVIAVIGPGTGLGVALLVPLETGGWRVLPGEGGHAGLSPTSDREIAILFQLIQRYGHVKAEHALSGPGLEILWETLASLDGAPTSPRPLAGEIAERARRGACEISTEAVRVFTGWLGGFAGDVALIAGARGGVYLAGGVLPRWGKLLDEGLFRRRFFAKGSHRPIMEATPVRLIVDKEATFKGLLAIAAGDVV